MSDMYSYTPHAGDFTGLFLFFLALVAIFVLFNVIGMWRTFQKAGKPGWAAIIPFYNTWVLAEVAGYPGWYGLYPFLAFIPLLGSIAAIIINIFIVYRVAKAFGYDIGMTLVLLLVPAVGYMVIGFGDALYNPNRTNSW